MPDTKHEGQYQGEFLISEAKGDRSREEGVVAEGQNLQDGQVLAFDGDGELVAQDGALDSDGELDSPVVGILYGNVDATNAAKRVAYIARDAEVDRRKLVYPDDSEVSEPELDAVDAGLAALNIVVRM